MRKARNARRAGQEGEQKCERRKARGARKEHWKLKIENFKIQNKRITVNQFKIFYLKFEFSMDFLR